MSTPTRSVTPILLDAYGREVKPDYFAPVRAKFDLAQSTAHNRKHWSMADSLSAKAAMSPAIRSLVRKRSRYEADNNSWYSGMLRTASNHIIGNGPRLQVLTDNPVANTRIERAWNRWSRSVMLADKLRVMVETYWRDGEVLAMRTCRPKNWPISLDIRTYEAEQCAAPWIGQSLGDPYIDDGVRVDPNTNEVEYFFYDHHPGDTSFAPSLGGKWYPSNEVIHLYRRERPGQTRGIPRCTSSLNTLPVMRRQEMATLLAAETAASFATYLKSTGSAIGAAQSPADFAEIEIAFNMLTTLPEGWDIAQVDPKHPGPNYNQFQMQALMSFARCTNMPLALAAGTAKDSNFSSYKGDIKSVWQPEVCTEQNRIELAVIETVFRWFLEDAVYVPGLLDGLPSISEIDHQWYWAPLPNLDEVEAATAAQLRISTGQSTLSKEHANKGTDYDTEITRLALDFGVDEAVMKQALFVSTYKIPPTGLPAIASQPSAVPAGATVATGEYTTLGQRDWNNNQKRIRSVLDQLTSGQISQGMARVTLSQIGLAPETIQAYLNDAADGQVSAPELQEVPQ